MDQNFDYTGFYITDPFGNNAFSYEQRSRVHEPKIWVAPLIEGGLEDVIVGKKIVFEEVESGLEKKSSPDSTIHSCYGLEYFIHTKIESKDVYIFDNHNHSFYFWSLHPDHRHVVHIDQHSDMRAPELMFDAFRVRTRKNLESGLQKKSSPDSTSQIFNYTNFCLNIGNFIIPALQMGMIDTVLQVTGSLRDGECVYVWENEQLQKKSTKAHCSVSQHPGTIILDLDLDYFAPEMDFIPWDDRMKIVRYWLDKADVVTVATSPYFLDQDLVSKLLREIFT